MNDDATTFSTVMDMVMHAEAERARQEERAAVVAFLRAAANAPHPSELGAPMLSPSGRGLLLLHADFIERGEHCREEGV